MEHITHNKNILSQIIQTIVFFDLFNHPLTAKEIWQNIGVKCSLEYIENILSLENLKTIPKLSHKDGFYFLRGRDEIIQTRLNRFSFAQRKFKRAKKITKIFSYIPWVRMVAVGNMIGKNNLRDSSDIDLLIVTDKNRIWLARFFCVIIAQALGLRPRKNNTRDKICLSFFMSADNLCLENLMLKNIPKDLYFIYWFSGLMPIYSTNDIHTKFTQANNWIKKYLPNWQELEIQQAKKNKIYNRTLDLFFSSFEKVFKKLQLKIMPQELKELMNKDTRVVVNDSILKLHINDRRIEFWGEYNENIKNIL